METDSNNAGSKQQHQQSPYLQNEREVERIFHRFDTNGDGKISTSELANILKALGSDHSADDVTRMMDDLDTNGDGFINLDEFSKFCKDSASLDSSNGEDGGVREIRDAFDLYDKNHNGLISASELHLVLSRLGESCSVEDCARMIQSVDVDGDGNLCFNEFKKMMTNNSSSNFGSSTN